MPSWAQEQIARSKGEQQATEARRVELDPGPFGGFVASALSSIPELFGQDASTAAEEFRNKYPVAGFVSEVVPTLAPYVGWAKATELPALAGALERTVAKTGLSALENPISYNAVKEVARFAPLELSRLGVGLATAPSENYGNLFADVGLSVALAGAGGSILGFLKAGGSRAAEIGHVAGRDIGLKPTFELRMGLQPEAQATAGELSDVNQRLLREVLAEKPLSKSSYVAPLESADPKTDLGLNSLFRAQSSVAKDVELDKRTLELATDGKDMRRITVDKQNEVLAAAGFKDMTDLASTLQYPRLVSVRSQRAAGALAKVLDDNPALQWAGDGVLMAREADGGLWVTAKRVRSGAASTDTVAPGFVRMYRSGDGADGGWFTSSKQYAEQLAARDKTKIWEADVPRNHKAFDSAVEGQGPENGFTFNHEFGPGEIKARALGSGVGKTFGKTRIAEGDEWLIGKTDKPQRLVPEAHKVAEANVAQWAKLSEAYRPRSSDIFNAEADKMLQALTPTDYRDLKTMTRAGWTSRMSEKLVGSGTDMLGIKGTTQSRAMADALYDVLKPTMFKEAQNPLYARFFGLMRNNIRVADEHVNKMMPEIGELYQGLTAEERTLVGRAATTQTPAESLAKLSADGTISEAAAKAVTRLQAINRQFLDEVVVPGLKNAGLDGKFDFLDGYILPRVFKGDWQVEVKAGEKTQWLAVGKTPAAAKAEADAVVEEAAARGLTWTRTEAADHAAEFASEDVRKISELVSERMASNAEANDVVVSAMQRLAAARAGSERPLPVKRALGTFKERTGIKGSPDIHEYTLEDLMKSTEAHYRQLGHFVGYHTWRERWLPEAFTLQKMDPTLYKDLLRKGNQFMGIPGDLTKVQDQALKPILGSVLGNKPATRIAQEVNGLMYNWNLAIVNPSFALLNLLQPLQTVAPWISYVTNVAPEYASKMMQFIPRYGADGLPRGQLGFFHPMKVLGQATKMLKSKDEEVLEFYKRAEYDGTMASQLKEDWIGGYSRNALTLKETFEKEGAWQGIKKVSTLMATKSEEYSRMIAFNSGYLIGKQHFGLEGDALYRFARRATEVTMYQYSVVDRPRLFTGPLGSTFGLFKNWQFHFIGQMAEYAGVGLKQGVWGPMLWQGGAALALGGLGATPLKMMADGLAKWHSEDKTGYLWMQENWGDAADEIYFGLPAFLGVSLQSSATVPGTDIRNDVSSLMSIVAWERAKAVGKAVGTAWDRADVTGQNPLKDKQVVEQMQAALAPRAWIKAASSLEGNYVKQLTTGYPQTEPVSRKSQLLNAVGFNPLEVQRQIVAGQELWKDQQATRKMVMNLGAAYAEAQGNGDWQEMEGIVQRTIAMGVPLSSVMQSAQTRLRREQGSNFDRYDQDKVAEYKAALGL